MADTPYLHCSLLSYTANNGDIMVLVRGMVKMHLFLFPACRSEHMEVVLPLFLLVLLIFCTSMASFCEGGLHVEKIHKTCLLILLELTFRRFALYGAINLSVCIFMKKCHNIRKSFHRSEHITGANLIFTGTETAPSSLTAYRFQSIKFQ